MITSKYLWFKAVDSTEWVRLPMNEALSTNRITSNIWFKAADSTAWVFLPMDEALSKPIKPEVEKQSTARPVHPEPQKVLSDPKPLTKEEIDPIAAAKAAEIDRIWAEFYKKRTQEAQQKPAPKPKPEAMPIKIWVA